MSPESYPFRVYQWVYPLLGGLGWICFHGFATKSEADAKRRELISFGHDPKRVAVNKA